MKILFVRRGVYPSSEFPEARQFAELLKFGHDVEIVCLSGPGDLKEESINDVKVYRLAPNLTSFRLLFPFLVMKFLLGKKYDVIHVFWGKGLSLVPFFLRGTSRVWVDDVRSGHIGNQFSSFVINSFIVLESIFFDRILTLDERLYRKIWGNLPLGDFFFKSKVYFVPMGVDTGLFKKKYDRGLATSFDIKEKDQVFVYVGTLVRSRKMSLFIEAFALALKKMPGLKLVMVGKGDEEPEIRRKIKSLGIGSQVKLVGPVLYNLVPQYISLGDFGVSYVPQNKSFENQQVTKSLEYLSCGLPVLGTKIPFHLDTIGPKDGVLTDDDPREVEKGIIKIVELSEKGQFKDKPRVQNEYSWRYIVRNRLLPAYLGRHNDKDTQ